jgi:aspartate N-acetyltransferase
MHVMDPHSKLLVRFADIDEAGKIAGILYQAFVEFKDQYTDGGFALTTPTAHYIRERWHEGPVWVSLTDGRMVGTVGVVGYPPSLHIRSMAVLPAARGQGVASALMRRIENYALTNGYASLDLCTTPFLSDAIRLYVQFGFANTGVSDLAGTPLITMQKLLIT